jgi:hydrogenase maturation factor
MSMFMSKRGSFFLQVSLLHSEEIKSGQVIIIHAGITKSTVEDKLYIKTLIAFNAIL